MRNLLFRDESCKLLVDSEAFLSGPFLSYGGQEFPPEDDLAEDMVKIESNPEVGLLFACTGCLISNCDNLKHHCDKTKDENLQF